MTKAEAKQLAGELLRLVPIGQALQSHHDTRLGEAYDEIYALLQVKGLAVWDSTGSMPDEISEHFTAMMAWNKKDVIGVSDAVYQRLLLKVGIDYEKALANIRNLVNGSYESADEETDY